MKTKVTILITGLVLLIIASLVYYYPNQHKKIVHRNTNWNIRDFSINDRQAYGLYYVFSTIKKGTSKQKFNLIDKSLSEQLHVADTGSVYLFVGKDFYYTERDLDSLMAFVANGNVAFFSAYHFGLWPDFNKNSLSMLAGNDNICIKMRMAAEATLQFTGASPDEVFPFHFQQGVERWLHDWRYFAGCRIEDEFTIEVVSLFNDEFPNMIAVAHGKGTIYLHLNPIMFTNYFFVEVAGLDYINTCFQPFTGKKIYWDVASRNLEVVDDDDDDDDDKTDDFPNFLTFIFSHRELNWAWHLMLAGVLLFVLFRSKRTQRIIPVIPAPKNRSADFVETVAALYYQPYNHQHIANEMRNQFLQFIVNKYGIKVNLKNFADHIADIEYASGISGRDIHDIFVLAMQLEVSTEDSRHRLLKLNELLDNFYTNSK